MDTRTAHAFARFGMGRRGAEPPPADLDAWLAAQLDRPDPALALGGPSGAEGMVAFREDRLERQQRQLEGAPPPGTPPDSLPHRVRDMVRSDGRALIDYVLTTQTPFRERLVWFWATHFTVSLRRSEVAPVVLPFLREAIRPHVAGRFGDMLLAVMRHPAMLIYLDNEASIGPTSQVGLKNHRGLNENLARESLELHTVSPAAGYTQADVTEYAKTLTGWSYAIEVNPPQFVFRAGAHEPGGKTVLGQNVAHGEAGGLAMLAWLADHPSTHRHLAEKLVRHFVADAPPPAAVERIAAVLRATHGDLKAASLELTRLPDAWTPLTKLRSPMDFVVAVMRALELPSDKRPEIEGIMGALGQQAFNAPLPNGWPDTATEWAGPEAMLRRVDWVYSVAGRAAAADPEQVAFNSLGPLLGAATLDQVRHAGARRDALTLVLSSPEFLRR